MEFSKVLQVLGKQQIPLAPGKLVKDMPTAAKEAKQMGYPVVLKAVGKKLLHKTELGAVALNLATENELSTAYATMDKKVKKYKPEGMYVQKMIRGREVIIGTKRDPTFGPVVMVGLGGIFVEVMKDVSFRIIPVTKEDCKAMLEELQGYPLLQGVRKTPPINLDALIKLMLQASDLMMKNKSIEQMDFNPVMADEKKVQVADVRILVSE